MVKTKLRLAFFYDLESQELIKSSEAVFWRCSVEKVLEILQYS